MAKIIPVENGTKKEVICKEAAALFKEKGFSATSMRDIAESIGVEAPSLYNHISSKNEILQLVCFRIADLFITYINNADLSDLPFAKKLELIIRFHIHMMLNEYPGVYVSEHEWKHLPEPHLSNYKNQRKKYHTRLAGIVKKGIVNNELNTIHPSVAVLSILSAIGGIEYWHRSKKGVNARLLEENMVKVLLEGIKK